jgi:hypothetical protein
VLLLASLSASILASGKAHAIVRQYGSGPVPLYRARQRSRRLSTVGTTCLLPQSSASPKLRMFAIAWVLLAGSELPRKPLLSNR